MESAGHRRIGLCLLVLGIRGDSLTLRWLSLLLFLATIAKVFLHQANAKMDDAILARLFKLYGVDYLVAP